MFFGRFWMAYLGLLINADFYFSYPYINLLPFWATYNVFITKCSDRSSSYIIRHYTLGLTEYQGLSKGDTGNYCAGETAAVERM